MAPSVLEDISYKCGNFNGHKLNTAFPWLLTTSKAKLVKWLQWHITELKSLAFSIVQPSVDQLPVPSGIMLEH